jgi:TatD DNase family protein
MNALSLLELLITQVKAGAIAPPRAIAMPRAQVAQMMSSSQAPARSLRFVDIGANLLDSMFEGEYRGKQAHPSDVDAVLARAADAGVERLIVTAGSLEESKAAIRFVRAHRAASSPVQLYATVGVHPTRALEFLPESERAQVEAAMARLAVFTAPDSKCMDDKDGLSTAQDELAKIEQRVLGAPHVCSAIEAHARELHGVIREAMAEKIVVAVGECGLDYDRLFFCPAAVQASGFKAQLALAETCGLPLFLHNRNTGGDFAAMMTAASSDGRCAAGGVVHSFDGDASELSELLSLDLHIGLNGCSLKMEENLRVAAQVPLDRLHLETDAPWCSVKRTHAGFPHVRPLILPISGDGGKEVKEVKKEKWETNACVKDRCEPCHIHHVLQVLSGIKFEGSGSSPAADEELRLAEAAYANSMRVFWPNEDASNSAA